MLGSVLPFNEPQNRGGLKEYPFVSDDSQRLTPGVVRELVVSTRRTKRKGHPVMDALVC
jgi:hypothetical protein